MSAASAPEITWGDRTGFGTGHPGAEGRLGDLQAIIWTISYRGDHRGDGLPWSLRCLLPGIKQDVAVESVQAGQARAVRQLAVFLQKIGVDV